MEEFTKSKLIKAISALKDDKVKNRYNCCNGYSKAIDDVLSLISHKRTEEEVLKEFEEHGYKVFRNDDIQLKLIMKDSIYYNYVIDVIKPEKSYDKSMCNKYGVLPDLIEFWEHKLIDELFDIWELKVWKLGDVK